MKSSKFEKIIAVVTALVAVLSLLFNGVQYLDKRKLENDIRKMEIELGKIDLYERWLDLYDRAKDLAVKKDSLYTAIISDLENPESLSKSQWPDSLLAFIAVWGPEVESVIDAISHVDEKLQRKTEPQMSFWLFPDFLSGSPLHKLFGISRAKYSIDELKDSFISCTQRACCYISDSESRRYCYRRCIDIFFSAAYLKSVADK